MDIFGWIAIVQHKMLGIAHIAHLWPCFDTQDRPLCKRYTTGVLFCTSTHLHYGTHGTQRHHPTPSETKPERSSFVDDEASRSHLHQSDHGKRMADHLAVNHRHRLPILLLEYTTLCQHQLQYCISRRGKSRLFNSRDNIPPSTSWRSNPADPSARTSFPSL